MNIQLIRHATLIVRISGHTLLVDPMFSAAGAADVIANTPNPRRNPLVDLPFNEEELVAILESLDAVVVTHTHNDHWDQRSRDLLPKSLPLFCQPEDETKIEKAGFEVIHAVVESLDWMGVHITRTAGQHGRGEIGKLMAPVSGFVLRVEGEPVLYIAGDTIWCADVQEVLDLHKPDVVVVNAGAAQFLTGGPITMDVDDVVNVAKAAPEAMVIAVHMEAINHCLLSRDDLRKGVDAAGVGKRVWIPEEGETDNIRR